MSAINETSELWTTRLTTAHVTPETASTSDEGAALEPQCCWIICNICCWVKC